MRFGSDLRFLALFFVKLNGTLTVDAATNRSTVLKAKLSSSSTTSFSEPPQSRARFQAPETRKPEFWIRGLNSWRRNSHGGST
ncbi:hypothetical protein ON010_g8591 [Phytophthora cinnamomi]|nr:hypothetical protein ON010_g8591 [Phytophthora cinnamomi]